MQHQEFFIDYKKYTLFGQYWLPNDCKAMVLLVHGMGEYSSRFEEFVIPELLAKHIGVFSYDNFGHGKSSGKRGDCPSYNALQEVLGRMFTKAQEISSGAKLFLYGHSMGGNLVINYVLRNNPDIVGAILTSPFLRIAFEPPGWKMMMGRLLHKIAPSTTLPSGLDPKAISRLPAVVQKYIEDPLIHDRISPNFSFPIMDAGVWAIENAATLTKSILVLHGTGDQITDHTASKELADKTPHAEIVFFDDGYHELHNDVEKEKMITTVIDWIEKKR